MEIDRDWCKKWQCNFCNGPGQFLKKVGTEGLQFAQQQFYKVHFLLASKISLFISEGKNPPKSGTLGQTQKNESNSKDSSFQTSDLYIILCW